MFSGSAEFYDLIYASFKDYPREAELVADLLRTRHPRCRTVLDVACGTGEHARLLATRYGFAVDGLDLDPALVGIARTKPGAGRFVQADMVDFHLDRRYDAVLCLFSSIGYACTLPAVARTLACFREHLAGDGVILVEPWFPPGVLGHGYTETRTIETAGLRIVRDSHLEVADRLSRIRFTYKIHGPGGVRHATEVHELGLFTADEMTRCFAAAGLAVEYDPQGLTGRGLYTARLAPERYER